MSIDPLAIPDSAVQHTSDLGLQSFFNSFSMETQDCQVAQHHLYIPLGEQQLVLPLSYVSTLGRHRYQGNIYLINSAEIDNKHQVNLNINDANKIDFSRAVSLLVSHYFPNIDAKTHDRFFNRVGESTRYINRALLALEQRSQLDLSADSFIQSEQSLIGGHSMHPAPKSCEPLTEEHQYAYLPEYAQSFAIEWFAIHPNYIASQTEIPQLLHTFKALLQNNLSLDGKTTNHIPTLIQQGWLALPMHPLQAKEWRKNINNHGLSEYVVDCQLSTHGWTATSSTRAIYHPKLAWMLKVSLPVKLTNSLRLLSEKEAKRGVQFSQILQTATGQEMQQRMPQTKFIQEPIWASVKNSNDQCLDLPLVCLRENIFYRNQESLIEQPSTHLLATANQNINDKSQVGQWIKNYAQATHQTLEIAARQWLNQFMDNVIQPLCIARSDYGIIFLAHQQNILLDIENNRPIGMKYRDCQGIGLTDIALKQFSDLFDNQDPEYFVPQDKVDPYLSYYLVGNTLLNTIAAICADTQIEEHELWSVCQHAFSKWRQARPKDSAFYDYLLNSPTLRWKRNFFCFLSDFNEATLPDPSQIYCEIDNPFYHSQPKARLYKPLPSSDQQSRSICIESLQVLSENDHSHQRFAMYELGLLRGEFDLILSQNTIYIDTELAEPMLWWSAAEHAFYTSHKTELHCGHWPDFVLPHLTDGKLLHKTFLQVAPIWHQPAKITESKQRHTAANGISHPTRPPKPVGTVFQRYCYHLKRTVSFRMIDISRDLDIFHQWHNHPLTSPIWELEGSLEMHSQYLQKLEQDPHQFAVIGEFDGVAFGYFEVYWSAEDRLGPHYECQDYDRGIHILVGNLDYRGGTFFDAWGKSILHYCFLVEPQTNSIVGEPNAKNHRVVKITERIGMKKQFEFDFPHKRAALLQCQRQDFFENIIF
ncbi:GNAT family N-acetyltransferase [Vibrio algivorus]|uniref:GNAT family N-acetyltransferase n=1 Tax=Vibrio algivorus TaxID=1667024 RepID=A0A557P9T6_9VIBR|nr:GNAT family N-acetyltransferase [Vibrio algivorus]TVO37412.1 GNAT family N-acetyltransferase [Vibrio algivorus]